MPPRQGEGEVKRRSKKKLSPTSPTPSDEEIAPHENESSRVRGETAEGPHWLFFEDSGTNWDYTDFY
ncbi:hypothetical protein RB213_005622 [Colletotrichum asianum]